MSDISGKPQDLGDKAEQAAGKAQGVAEDVAGKAQGVANKAQGAASKVAGDVADKAQEVAGKAQQAMHRAEGTVRQAAEKTNWNPLAVLGRWGIRSSHAYAAGFLAIGATVVKWLLTLTHEPREQADRTGLFIGEWAPTLFALGVALKHEEERR
ncbi:hypothetical protein [Microbacterium sediminis]|uniref:hypothetical protein n=1 Tax=Microbacterium sediminis TaxID=904291 RepID=UPI001F0B4798|nr:hypothetical protein [Microbacterium sediminis]